MYTNYTDKAALCGFKSLLVLKKPLSRLLKFGTGGIVLFGGVKRASAICFRNTVPPNKLLRSLPPTARTGQSCALWVQIPPHTKKALLKAFKIWDRRDSNPRPRDYESPALPLRHSPENILHSSNLPLNHSKIKCLF